MSAAYSRSSMKSKQPPPSARHSLPRAPEPSEPHGSALQERICSSSCLSWLHLLKSWSLRQSRGGSVGLERFPLLGISQGCAISIAYAAKHPERVSRLVLYGGYAKGWMLDPANVPRGEAMATLIREGWDSETSAFRQVFTSRLIPDASAEQICSFSRLQRSTTSPENACRLYKVFSQLDVRHLLADLAIPTLILHAREDGIVKFSEGQELASRI